MPFCLWPGIRVIDPPPPHTPTPPPPHPHARTPTPTLTPTPACTHTHTHTHKHAQTHARTHARTHAHAQHLSVTPQPHPTVPTPTAAAKVFRPPSPAALTHGPLVMRASAALPLLRAQDRLPIPGNPLLPLRACPSSNTPPSPPQPPRHGLGTMEGLQGGPPSLPMHPWGVGEGYTPRPTLGFWHMNRQKRGPRPQKWRGGGVTLPMLCGPRLVAVGGSWWLAVRGGWRLAVGGPWGRSFAKKMGSLRTALLTYVHCELIYTYTADLPPMYHNCALSPTCTL